MKRLISALLFVAIITLVLVPTCVFAENSTEATTEEPFVNKIFQGVFVVVMTIGLIGLPAYFWLNARRNRLLREYKENKSDDDVEADSED